MSARLAVSPIPKLLTPETRAPARRRLLEFAVRCREIEMQTHKLLFGEWTPHRAEKHEGEEHSLTSYIDDAGLIFTTENPSAIAEELVTSGELETLKTKMNAAVRPADRDWILAELTALLSAIANAKPAAGGYLEAAIDEIELVNPCVAAVTLATRDVLLNSQERRYRPTPEIAELVEAVRHRQTDFDAYHRTLDRIQLFVETDLPAIRAAEEAKRAAAEADRQEREREAKRLRIRYAIAEGRPLDTFDSASVEDVRQDMARREAVANEARRKLAEERAAEKAASQTQRDARRELLASTRRV